MGRRELVRFVFLPIGVYVSAMLLLSVFVTHPPALGWIGLAVATIVALLAGGLVVVLFPRMSVNGPRLHPHSSPVHRLLLVLDVDVDAAELGSAVGLRMIGRRAEVRVVAPVVATPTHFAFGDEQAESDEAALRLRTALTDLADAGIRAEGTVGTDDPVQAVGDVLADYPADEILFVGAISPTRGWLDRDFERRVRDLFGVPVSTVFGTTKRDGHDLHPVGLSA